MAYTNENTLKVVSILEKALENATAVLSGQNTNSNYQTVYGICDDADPLFLQAAYIVYITALGTNEVTTVKYKI